MADDRSGILESSDSFGYRASGEMDAPAELLVRR
jgi:hypothetical protein